MITAKQTSRNAPTDHALNAGKKSRESFYCYFHPLKKNASFQNANLI